MASTIGALDTNESQATFRVLLDTLAQPGRVRMLPAGVPRPPAPPALAVPLALADLGQSVAVVGDDDPDGAGGVGRWAAVLREVTACALVPAEEADQVVALGGARASLIDGLRRGSALAPEQGCRLVVACERLSAHGPAAVTVALRGPGVDGVAMLGVDGVDPALFAALAAANAAFPAGIDTWLVSSRGEIAAIPRSASTAVG